MKVKQLISLLLSLVMILGALPVVALTASAEGETKTYYYYEDFEGIPTKASSQEIADMLGWSGWDHTVATLKIVETVYMREFNASYSSKITDNAAALKTKLGMSEDWDARNIKTVDVAAIKSVSAFASVDFTVYKSYNKKLLITPATANGDTSIILTDNVNLGASNIFVDYELTPRYKETMESSNAADVERSYNSDSSLGITLTNGSGKSFSQALMVNGSLRYTYSDGTTPVVDDILCSEWHGAALGKLYRNEIALDYVAGEKFRTYKDGANGSLFLSKLNTLNSLRFTYRMKFGKGTFSSWAGNPAKVTDTDTSYMKADGDPNASKWKDWGTVSNYRDAAIDAGAKAMLDNSIGSVSLSVNNAGVAYYLDNIAVADHNGGAKAATVSVNTYNGANARIDQFAGLRWTSNISQVTFDKLASDNTVTNVSIGTVIAPTSILGEKSWSGLGATECIKLALTAEQLQTSEVTDGNYTFKGSIINIKPGNYTKLFSAVGYISYTSGSDTYIIYGGYSEAAHARSVREVAKAALADVKTAEEVKTAEDGKYTVQLGEGEMYVNAQGELTAATKDDTFYSCYTSAQRNIMIAFLQTDNT